MKLPHRRQVLHLAAGAAALPVVSRIAQAQGYPSRPVRIIVTTAAGSTTDVHGRLHSQWLSERLGQPFIVENRSGGATTLGAAEAIRSRLRSSSSGFRTRPPQACTTSCPTTSFTILRRSLCSTRRTL